MNVFLMRHGQALAETEDPLQGLSAEGVTQIRASAGAMKRLGLFPELVLCSPKKRAKQTAALVAEIVNYPYSDIVESELLLPRADPETLVALLEKYRDRQSLLLVGHLPSLNRILSLLLGGGEIPVSFESGGVCCVARDDGEDRRTELCFCLTAEQLRLLA